MLLIVPPKIEHQGLIHIKVTMGSPAELPCKASGIPRPRIVWQKGTRAVADEPGMELVNVLIIGVPCLISTITVNKEPYNSLCVSESLFVF